MNDKSNMKTDWTLLAKVFSGEADAGEEERFRRWSGYSEENKQLSDMLRRNWDEMKNEAPGEKMSFDTDRAWKNLKDRLAEDGLAEQREPHGITLPGLKISMPALRIAAAAAVIIAMGITALLLFSPSDRTMQMTAATEDRQELGILLPDGSVADMNAWSRLQYSTDESGGRTVELRGEAFFDVKHDPGHPFIIGTGDARIVVTGTSFGVRNDPESKKIEVYVESGNVNVYRSRKPDRILSLKAGQTGILEQDRLEMLDYPDPNRLSWKTGKLSFRETRLGDVAGVLNRTYSRQIRFGSEALEDCLFTGTFDQQPIDSVVRVIQVAFDLDLDRQGKAYVLSGEGCN